MSNEYKEWLRDIQYEEMEELINALNKFTKAYDEGHPMVSDKEWDGLYFKLKDLEKKAGYTLPNSPTQTIVYDIVGELKKVPHDIPMLSLDKTKDWDNFLQYFSYTKDVIGMLKLDGLTCRLKYKNGNLIEASTRGKDGLIGEDILHNTKVISSIPKVIEYKEDLTVDGEIICNLKTFNKYFSDEYSNARNFAAGSIRLLNAGECYNRRLTFIAWNVVDGFEDTNSFMSKLIKLEKLGFDTVPWVSSFDWDAKEFLVNKAESLGYPIDGLVGRYDDVAYGRSLGATGHHARAAYAFKFYDEEYETTLKDIEWSLGRTSVLTPVAIFEPVDTGDSIIERASLHNISVMNEILGKPYIGQKIWITKRNQIIPNVERAEKWDSLM